MVRSAAVLFWSAFITATAHAQDFQWWTEVDLAGEWRRVDFLVRRGAICSPTCRSALNHTCISRWSQSRPPFVSGHSPSRIAIASRNSSATESRRSDIETEFSRACRSVATVAGTCSGMTKPSSTRPSRAGLRIASSWAAVRA